jgi:hypothetical protein
MDLRKVRAYLKAEVDRSLGRVILGPPEFLICPVLGLFIWLDHPEYQREGGDLLRMISQSPAFSTSFVNPAS